MPPRVFNPLDKANLGKSVVEALMEAPAVPLGGLPKFPGAGVYAIYYSGLFPEYLPLAAKNRPVPVEPIYVGKAVPKGGRKGLAVDAEISGAAIWDRLTEHAGSIEAGSGLEIGDFSCRVLVVDDSWIGLGETLLIQRFRPLWNQVVEGFGNHNPGAGRHRGKRPRWDELHPGRSWARRCKPAARNRVEILAAVSTWMSRFDVPQP